jgi:hypothetical protein
METRLPTEIIEARGTGSRLGRRQRKSRSRVLVSAAITTIAAGGDPAGILHFVQDDNANRKRLVVG